MSAVTSIQPRQSWGSQPQAPHQEQAPHQGNVLLQKAVSYAVEVLEEKASQISGPAPQRLDLITDPTAPSEPTELQKEKQQLECAAWVLNSLLSSSSNPDELAQRFADERYRQIILQAAQVACSVLKQRERNNVIAAHVAWGRYNGELPPQAKQRYHLLFGIGGWAYSGSLPPQLKQPAIDLAQQEARRWHRMRPQITAFAAELKRCYGVYRQAEALRDQSGTTRIKGDPISDIVRYALSVINELRANWGAQAKQLQQGGSPGNAQPIDPTRYWSETVAKLLEPGGRTNKRALAAMSALLESRLQQIRDAARYMFGGMSLSQASAMEKRAATVELLLKEGRRPQTPQEVQLVQGFVHALLRNPEMQKIKECLQLIQEYSSEAQKNKKAADILRRYASPTS